jgi:tRNA (cytosine38-C5)-methyltransferase
MAIRQRGPNRACRSLGKKLDVQDPRAAAIVRLISIWPKLSRKPQLVLLENVVNFESSETRTSLVSMFDSVGYEYQEFHLSPTQFGVPNSRMRYYCLAKLQPLQFSCTQFNKKLIKHVPSSHFFDDEGHPMSTVRKIKEYLDRSNSEATEEDLAVPSHRLIQAGLALGSLPVRPCLMRKLAE